MRIKHGLPEELELDKIYQLKLEEVSGEIKIPPDKTIFRRKGGIKVWWMEKRLRRHIATMEVFNAMGQDLGFTWTNVLTMEPGWKYDPCMLEDIEEGKVISKWPESEPEEEDVLKMLFAQLPYKDMSLGQVKGLGFNSFQSYQQSIAYWKHPDDYLNKAAALGMRCLTTLPDVATAAEINKLVGGYMNHKAYWGVLSFDDADWRCWKGHWTTDDMQRVYDMIKKVDPNHPVCCSVCHGASRTDDSWHKYLRISAFDAFFYEPYVWKEKIPDGWEWLKYMFDRLEQYPELEGKLFIPILPTFERGPFKDPTGKIWDQYVYMKDRLNGKKSVACYDMDDLRKYEKYWPEVRRVNADI